MYRVIAPPKTPGETQIFKIDASSKLSGSQQIVNTNGVYGNCSVYSGSPQSIPTPVFTYSGNVITVTIAGGYMGTVYSVAVYASINDGSVLAFTYYLSVIPEVP